MRLSQNLLKSLGSTYAAALPGGLPLFPMGVPASTPINAAPYLIDLATYRADFGFNDWRRRQLDRLDDRLAQLRSSGFSPLFLVAGGSFLDRRRPDPKDLDGALFYASSPDGDPGGVLRQVQEAAGADGLDLRLMPFDASPALVAKLIGFFVLLYAARVSAEAMPAVAIVDVGG